MSENKRKILALVVITLSLASLVLFFCGLESMIEQGRYLIALIWGGLTCLGLQIGAKLDK